MTHTNSSSRSIPIVLATIVAAFGVTATAQPTPIRIGIAKSFLIDQPKGITDIAADEFKANVRRIIGLDNAIQYSSDAAEIADKLNGKQLDFGLLHAHEFVWAKKKHPDLRPLVIAEGKLPFRVCVIVRKDSPAKTMADLRGKKLDMPLGAKEPCRVFLAKYCTDKETKSAAQFFGAIEKSPAPNEALDNVARGKVQAAIIDTANLAFYQEVRGPVFEKNLRILVQSEVFPPAVIVYKPGVVDQAVVDQFKSGLLKAHTTADGRDLMKSWDMTAFEPASKDYDQRLGELLKSYPAPE